MRLIFKKYDSEFQPIVMVFGLFLAVASSYGALQFGFSGPVVLWVLRTPFYLAAAMGILIVIREIQLWRDCKREHSG